MNEELMASMERSINNLTQLAEQAFKINTGLLKRIESLEKRQVDTAKVIANMKDAQLLKDWKG